MIINIMNTAPQLISASFTALRDLAESALAVTDTLPAISLDVAEDANPDNYRYTFFLPPSEKDAFESVLDALPTGALLTPCVFEDVDTSIDYIAQNRAAFPPLTVGPFFIARNDEDQPDGLIKLDIMPNRAFGSGEHATTTGCLLAYTHLIQSGETFEKGLDFGAGSGILAIAAAKQNSTPFTCIDIDAPSVAINNQNAQLNGVSHLVQAFEGDTPPSGKTFNLIFANILMQPLVDLAPQLTNALAPNGRIILSGFTIQQTEDIATAYTALGLHKSWEYQQGDWLAQIWQK